MTYRSPRAGWVHPLVIVLYTLLTGAMTWPLATQLTSAIPGDSFDGWQNYWNLWWIKVALVERIQNPFFTDLLYAPTGVGLYFHTLNPFNGVVTLPVQLSVGLMPAYNLGVWGVWRFSIGAVGAASASNVAIDPIQRCLFGGDDLHLFALPHGTPARTHAGDEPAMDALLHALFAAQH